MIRLAIIGDGETVAAYAKVAHRLQGARIAAVVDDNSCEPRDAAFGADVLTVSLAALLDQHLDAFDAAVIGATSEFGFGADGALTAALMATANKHLLMDARLVDSKCTADALIAAFEQSTATLAVGHGLRHQPDVRAVRESVASGKLGAPGLLRVHRWNPLDRDAPGDAWRDAILGDLTAEIDLACWLFGESPSVVFAQQQTAGDAGSIGSVQVHLGFPKGGMALIDVVHGLPSAVEYATRSVIGASGAAYADAHHDMQLTFQGGATRAVGIDWQHSHLLPQIQEFVDALAAGRQPTASPAAARLALQVAAAVAESIETGEAVSFPYD